MARTFANWLGLMRPLSGMACIMLMLFSRRLSRLLNEKNGGRGAFFVTVLRWGSVPVKFSTEVVITRFLQFKECKIGFREIYSEVK